MRLFLEAVTNAASGVISDIREVDAVGFKTVIAQKFLGDHELTDEVMAALEHGARIAPAHNIPYIETINVFKRLLPSARMVGAFETDFHRTVPFERQIYSVPYEWYERYGIRRYGYHGASHGYVAERLAALSGGRARRAISCHLGGSGSLCALLNGRSVDSTCGFSLQSGLPHSSRAGDIDPYIFPSCSAGPERGGDHPRHHQKRRSAGRERRQRRHARPRGRHRRGQRAGEAGREMYLHAIISGAGALYAVLGGLDALVFTGGIGENSAMVRARVCEALRHLGIRFDEGKNGPAEGERTISAGDSPVQVWVIPANEELNVARRAMALLSRG